MPTDAPLRLADGVRLQRQPVLDDGRFVWGVGLVTDGHPEGLPCSALVAQLLTRLNGRRTATDAIADLCNGLDAATIREVEPAARQTLEILYVGWGDNYDVNRLAGVRIEYSTLSMLQPNRHLGR